VIDQMNSWGHAPREVEGGDAGGGSVSPIQSVVCPAAGFKDRHRGPDDGKYTRVGLRSLACGSG